METLKNIMEYFQGLFEIIFSDTKSYQYSVKNLELKVRDGKYYALVKYVLIGSRGIQQNSPLELLTRRVFTKFNEADAEAIITLNTIVTLLNCNSPEEMFDKGTMYIKTFHDKKLDK